MLEETIVVVGDLDLVLGKTELLSLDLRTLMPTEVIGLQYTVRSYESPAARRSCRYVYMPNMGQLEKEMRHTIYPATEGTVLAEYHQAVNIPRNTVISRCRLQWLDIFLPMEHRIERD